MVTRVRLSGRGNRGQRPLTIIDAVNDPSLFKPFFKNPKSWATWFAILAAIFALPMTDQQLRLYQQVTGRTEPPDKIAKEVWLCIGRRGGKPRIISLIATWLACFFDYSPFLAPGEKGVVQVIACDRKQARVALRYVKAFLNQVPMLAEMIENETAESISLTNHIVIEVVTASFRSVRGFTLVAGLLDEIAYFRTEEDSANPDSEIIAALRPAMATIPNAMLLAASSPYAKRGTLYESHKAHFGNDHDPILVVQADTATVNPVVDAKVIADAYEQDPASAAAEYGGLFRSDIEGYVAREVVEACIARGVYERPPKPGLRYEVATDPSGGSADSFTLAIAHRDADSLIVDCVRETRPPFSPESVCAEYAGLLKTYRIKKIVGDRYAGLWPVEQFSKYGIRYEQSAQPKSILYQSLLPLLNSRRCELLDNTRLVTQLVNLERRTSRGGRDSIDHSPGAHDDLANCVAGVLTAIATRQQRLRMVIGIQDYAPRDGSSGAGYEVDPRTLRRLDADPYRDINRQ